MTTQQQLIDRLSQSGYISEIRQEGTTVHYTCARRPYRVEQEGDRLRLIGPLGILHYSDTVDDMCDFILI